MTPKNKEIAKKLFADFFRTYFAGSPDDLIAESAKWLDAKPITKPAPIPLNVTIVATDSHAAKRLYERLKANSTATTV